MVSYKQQLKIFRRPDALQKIAARWLAKAIEYKIWVFVGVGAVAALMIGMYGYNTIHSWKAHSVRVELAKIERVFDKELENVEHQQQALHDKLTALDTREAGLQAPDKLPKDSADAKLSADERANVLKTIAEEKKALEASFTDLKPDHSGSLKQFETFFAEHDGRPEGWRAGMRLAEIHMQNRNFEAAAGVLAKILAKSDKYDFYHVQVRLSYVEVLEELGRFDDAIAALEPITNQEDKELEAKILFNKGRLLLLKGDKEKAAELFDRIAKDFDKTAAAGKAKVVRFVWR